MGWLVGWTISKSKNCAMGQGVGSQEMKSRICVQGSGSQQWEMVGDCGAMCGKLAMGGCR